MASQKRQGILSMTNQQAQRIQVLSQKWAKRGRNATDQTDHYVNKALDLAEEDQAQWEASNGQE